MSAREKIKSFPRLPGVYLFKDSKGNVLYVGKAKRLKDRVMSYFATGRDARLQIEFLLCRTADVDFIVTDTEKEALLLENTLIKEHRPRYNVSLRDDKSYVSIRIGANHKYPDITLTRRIKKDGAQYFGPYDSGLAAREAVRLIMRYFKVRSCSDTEFANRVRSCLKFDIGLCTAPCVGRVSERDYCGQVKEAQMFLAGKKGELIRILEEKMTQASKAQKYENAAAARDTIKMLKSLVEKQKVVRPGGGDHDVVGLSRVGESAAICQLKIREGALVGKRTFQLKDACGEDGKLIEEFILGRYQDKSEIPPRIVISHKPEALRAIAEILSERGVCKLTLGVPLRGELKRLVDLAVTNAREALVLARGGRSDFEALHRIGRKVGLRDAPAIIECVDISNLSGREAVGSLVAFENGAPNKSLYRIYNIRTLETPDDYAMMQEVLSRRFSLESVSVFGRPMPDLLLVDGGKGQLGIAKRVLSDMGVDIKVASIAKGEKKGHADQIFIPGRKNPLGFKRGSKELLLLMRIRDEAHRFCINAHRKKRGKKMILG